MPSICNIQVFRSLLKVLKAYKVIVGKTAQKTDDDSED